MRDWRNDPDYVLRRYRERELDLSPPVSSWLWVGALASSLGFLAAVLYAVCVLAK